MSKGREDISSTNIPSTKESNFSYLLVHVGVLGHSTVNATIHQAFSGHGIRRCKIDVGRLLQEGYFEVKLLRYTLRRRVGIAWPDDVLDVQTLLLPRLPDADLPTNGRKNALSYDATKRYAYGLDERDSVTEYRCR